MKNIGCTYGDPHNWTVDYVLSEWLDISTANSHLCSRDFKYYVENLSLVVSPPSNVVLGDPVWKVNIKSLLSAISSLPGSFTFIVAYFIFLTIQHPLLPPNKILIKWDNSSSIITQRVKKKLVLLFNKMLLFHYAFFFLYTQVESFKFSTTDVNHVYEVWVRSNYVQ